MFRKVGNEGLHSSLNAEQEEGLHSSLNAEQEFKKGKESVLSSFANSIRQVGRKTQCGAVKDAVQYGVRVESSLGQRRSQVKWQPQVNLGWLHPRP